MPSARDSVAGLGLCQLQFLRQTWVQLAATEPFEPELGVLVGDALIFSIGEPLASGPILTRGRVEGSAHSCPG